LGAQVKVPGCSFFCAIADIKFLSYHIINNILNATLGPLEFYFGKVLLPRGGHRRLLLNSTTKNQSAAGRQKVWTQNGVRVQAVGLGKINPSAL